MKNGDKVVCINDVGSFTLKRGEIYTITGFSQCPKCGVQEISINADPMGFNIKVCTCCGHERDWDNSYRMSRFRPVDSTFGEVVAEIIEKQVEVEEMETV